MAPAKTWLVMNTAAPLSARAGRAARAPLRPCRSSWRRVGRRSSVVCRAGPVQRRSAHVAFKVGVQLHPQVGTVDELRAAWKAADAMGADSIWIWDHFFPLYGDPDAAHFEAYTLLAAMAA